MELEELVEPVVGSAGLDLVEASLNGPRGHRVLRVTVDRAGGVDLDAISLVSERISRRLDLEGYEAGPYTLEVSSPGLERALRAPREFSRAAGEQVRLKLAGPVEGDRTVSGTIVEADDDAVTVETAGGLRRIPYAEVASARTVFEWGGGR